MSTPEEILIQKIIYTAFFVPLLLCGVLIWFLVFYQKKKYATQLREKDLIISRQEALQIERTRIAGEMHDELGGGLTSIKFLSQSILRKVVDENEKSRVQKIVQHAETLVANMSEIIWAMNSGFDTLESLIAYTRRFAFDFLEDHQFQLDFNIEGNPLGYEFSGEKRRNIFLIIKESLHNAVKHSQGNKMAITFDIKNELEIEIVDDGKGFEQNPADLGNGINNMKDRAKKLNGMIAWTGTNGTRIMIKIPLPERDITPSEIKVI